MEDHRYRPPPWDGWPPASPTSGHDLTLGVILGEIKAGQHRHHMALERQHAVLERISQQIAELPRAIAQIAMTVPKPARERLTWRDWAQIAAAVCIVSAALLKKITPADTLELLSKLFGLG